ncbi:ferric enterobactin receptor [Catalinimonas alkaloidigena]|uniref:TonB-dependent receptor n=1 Tax=Catalinimonas alkaloidigena TaxID=1075417 RepID=UPI0024061E13|nr:TonB-dependent receptor [Catalinimonas alkaloidigena]MDF9798974.1 ferric enterobactin receptor [Catalinimonas alkaloidigena]
MPLGFSSEVDVKRLPLDALTVGKVLFFSLTVMLCLLLTTKVIGQKHKETVFVNEVFEGESLLKVIKHMQKKYHLKIAYERKLVQPYQVDLVLQQRPLEEAWESILSGTPLTCLLLGNGKVVIRRALPELVYAANSEKNTISAQAYTYAAVVRDIETGERIPYATVSIAGTSQGTVANQEGFFSLSHLSSLQDSLVVSHLGYAPSVLSLDRQRRGQKEVSLKSTYSILSEIEVVDQPAIGLVALSKRSGQHIVNPARTERMPQIGEKDVFRSLQLLPGISIANETSAKLSIRGSSSDQNLVLFDGFTLYHLDHLYGFFSSLNSDAIKDIRVYKGGFGVKYGGRASGVIDITGKSGNQYKPSLSLGLNPLSANLKAETPIGEKATAFLAFRRSYTDIWQTGLYNTLIRYADDDLPPLVSEFSNRGRDEHELFYYYDTNIKFSYRPGDKDKLSLSFYQGADDYDKSTDLRVDSPNIAYGESIQEQHQLGNTGLGISWSRIWNDRLFSNFSLGYSHYHTQYQLSMAAYEGEITASPAASMSLERENTLEEYAVKLDFEYTATPRHEVDFGFFMTSNEILYADQNQQQGRGSQILNQGTQSGIYVQHIYRPLGKLEVNTGIRTTYYSADQQLYVEPRLSANYELREGLFLKGAAGQYYQFINKANSNLGLAFDQDFWLLSGSDNLSVLSSQQYMTGFSYTKNNWLVDAEVYQKNISGLMRGGYESYVDVSGTRPYWNFNKVITDGTSEVKGLDVMLSKNWEHNSSSLSYSLSSAVQQFNEINEGAPFFADGDQRHEFKLSSQWEFSPWTFSLNWVYGSGQPYSAPSELAYENGRTRLIYHEKNNNRLPAYHRMDASVNYGFKIGKSKANIGLSVFNLYDQQNVGSRTFLFDRFGVFQRERSPSTIQLVTVDQLLMERTFSIFLNFNF